MSELAEGYLWDRTGTDVDLERMEDRLAIFSSRHVEEDLNLFGLHTAERPRGTAWSVAAAASLTLAAGLAAGSLWLARDGGETESGGAAPPPAAVAAPPIADANAEDVDVDADVDVDVDVEGPHPTDADPRTPPAAPSRAKRPKARGGAVHIAASGNGPENKTMKNSIREVVRGHISEIRYCYNQALTRDAAVAGRVAVQFAIGRKGKVREAAIASSDLDNEPLETCIVNAVKRWTFARLKNSKRVVVTYPFVLQPD